MDNNAMRYCEIIESFTASKYGNPDKNEDLIYIGDKYLAAIDGATSTVSGNPLDKTGGQLCVAAVVRALDRMSGNEQAREAMELICAEIAETEKDYNLKQHGVHCCACAVIYNCIRHEV